ncbi:MAG: EAL domain-containing protein, partial [Myxococcales bacterium]|nr:EAL domain-containing protein [Myxococcales bacterium]
RKAIERDELMLHYQPRISLESFAPVGLEALVRWQHGTLGRVPPSDFIPVAESTGLIRPVGDWILRAACRQARAWQTDGEAVGRVAVNVSAQQLCWTGFTQSVDDALATVGLAGDRLEVEVTESSLVHDVQLAAANLEALRERGIQIAIDDFGTGFSSLKLLRQLPLDAVKIDLSFVREIEAHPEAREIVRTIIAMGHNLGMRVVAEGVENANQRDFLAEHGCDEIQGYLFSPPLPPDELIAWFHDPERPGRQGQAAR